MACNKIADNGGSYYHSIRAPGQAASKEESNWYNRCMIGLAVHYNRSLVDDIPLQYLIAAKTAQYNTRLLMQYIVKEHRHRSSRMHNVLINNGKIRVAVIGGMSNDRASLVPMDMAARMRYNNLAEACEKDERSR